jgi:4'-phosphopantetheinyl transferase
MAAPASWSDSRDVRTSYAHISDAWRDPAARLRALDRLLPHERQRHDRFRRPDDRDMFLLGRVMARALVGDALGVDPQDWPWRDGPHGRPEIDLANCRFSFNLAHSGGMVVCALASRGLVGVDVEDRRRASLDRALVQRCCAPDEIVDVDAHGVGWQHRFLQYWTLKEAYLKARGLGITVHLPDVAFHFGEADEIRLSLRHSAADEDADWAFTQTTLGNHVVAMAATVDAGVRPVFHLSPFPSGWLP